MLRGQRALHRPAAPKPACELLRVDACARSPIRNAHRFAVEGDENVTPGVSRLLAPRAPSNVFRMVAAVVVGSLNRMMVRWPSTDVSKEVLELMPSFAHRDSAGAIQGVFLVLWILAAVEHCGPSSVFGSPVLRLTVSPVGASATCCMAVAQVPSTDADSLAAVASTLPCDVAAFVGASLDGHETAEALSCQINEGNHSPLSITRGRL